MAESANEIIAKMDADTESILPRKKWYFPTWASEISDIHGLKHITGKGSRVRRLIWLVIFIASSFVLALQTFWTIENFFQFHHVTKLDVSYQRYLYFPALTICNLNKYRMSQITAKDVEHVGRYLGEDYPLTILQPSKR